MKLLDSLNKLLFSQTKKQSDNNLGKVLVVSNTGFGDTILSTPAIKSLRKSFLNEKIIFLVNKKYSALFLNYKYNIMDFSACKQLRQTPLEPRLNLHFYLN